MTINHIIRMERAETSNGNPMWRCQTKEGNRVNVFGHDTMKWIDYNPELKDMQLGEVIRWTQYPIEVTMYKKGDYWNVSDVAKRPLFAISDKSTFNPKPYQGLARNWAFSAANHSACVYLDTETTGVTEDAEILSVSIISAATGEILLNTLVRPSSLDKITPEITELTGITKLQADTAPRFEAIQGQLIAHLTGRNVIVYNSSFDQKVIERACITHGLPIPPALAWVDAMQYTAMMYGDYDLDREQFTSIKLTEAVAKAGLQVSDAHSALGDTVMLRNLLIKMALPESDMPEDKDAMNAPAGFGD